MRESVSEFHKLGKVLGFLLAMVIFSTVISLISFWKEISFVKWGMVFLIVIVILIFGVIYKKWLGLKSFITG